MKSNLELINLYINSLEIKNYSKHTILNYEKDILAFYHFITTLDIESFSNVSLITIQNYRLELSKNEFSNNTKNRKLSSIRNFYRYLENEGYVEENLFLNVKTKSTGKRLPKFVINKEMKQLFSSIDTTEIKGMRDKTIIELLYGTGIRVSELCTIKTNDVNFYNETILIKGKGNKERLVPMHNLLTETLKQYYYRRNELLVISKNFETDHMFLNLKGKPLTARGVRLIIDKIVENASIKTNITPHMFRHSFATDLLNNGADIRSVQELLGHVNLSSTQIYTEVSLDRLKKSYNDAFPRRGKE